MAALSANYEFAHQLISRLQRTAGLTGRTAAWRRVSQWPVWAVLVVDSTVLLRKCCDRSNGGREPIVANAACCTNVRYHKRATIFSNDFGYECGFLACFLLF
jgi:hypothetical protein